MRVIGRLDRFFGLRRAGTTAGREVVAGLTTFTAMVYCVAVNPMILAAAGMDRASVLSATCLVAIVASAMVGLLANLPLGLAPAMGSNVIFAYVLVVQMGVPWPAALAVVCLTGVIFLVLTLTKWRERIAHELPDALRVGIQIAVGLVIMFIGMRNAGFVVASKTTFVTMGSLADPGVLLTVAGFVLTPALVARRVPGALILSIVAMTAAGLFIPDGHGGTITRWPERLLAMPVWPAATAFRLDFGYVARHVFYLLPMLFFFLCTELFGTLANLLGVVSAAGMLKRGGAIPRATEAFASDAVGTIVGPLLGTAVVTVYSESVTGVQAGGRTGLTALTIAAGFALSLFLWPLFMIVPPQATAPALLMVGMLMFHGIGRLDLDDPGQTVPAILTFMIALLTSNLINGMALGTFSYIVMAMAAGRGRALSPVLWVLSAVFVLFFIVSAHLHSPVHPPVHH
ncbi:NCS2 family permease [Nguyenibacter vanlangensis]|uniref:NCS2 family permease n=1 Tax=Nguyenibacter vanlangensis TaxID=1216886 RepID=A0A7Y7IX20_9PROT|nr:NCS2 family permease [Nguyenibacter vanlangensis]NVN11623.1 NCS2 family permease [Nguyenibacter vanlangensis]